MSDMSEGPMTLWQCVNYGGDEAAQVALCYHRARSWPVDDQRWPARGECEDRLYAFISGYEAAIQRAQGRG